MLQRRAPMPRKRARPRRKGKPAPRIKAGRQEDPEHLAALRRFGCWCCRVDGGAQWLPTETHHPRPGGKSGPGMGQKAPDKDALPLCSGHHRGVAGYLSIHMDPIQFRATYGTEGEIARAVAEAMGKQRE